MNDWESEVQQWETGGKKGTKPGKPKGIGYLKKVEPGIQKINHDIPQIWKIVILGEIFQVYVGSTPSRKVQSYWDNGEINWVSSGEVAFNYIYKTKEKITNLGLNNCSTVVHPIGTVMLAMIGEGITRGQAAILKIEGCHNQNSAAIRVTDINFYSEFLFYYFFLRYQRNRNIGSGNNQKALNQESVSNFEIPLCSLPEQNQIVLEIEKRLSVCDKMEETIKISLEKANALR